MQFNILILQTNFGKHGMRYFFIVESKHLYSTIPVLTSMQSKAAIKFSAAQLQLATEMWCAMTSR